VAELSCLNESSRRKTDTERSLLDQLSIVMLTYGNRHALLTQVVERVLASRPNSVIVVYNGNYDPELAPRRSEVTAVVLNENHGSAAGYAAGMERAMSLGAGWILLLDDDNLPEAGALEALGQSLALLGDDPRICLQTYRPGIEWHRLRLFEGTQTLARPNTYGWFHVANLGPIFRRGSAAERRPAANGRPEFPIARIPVACYGGLLLHRDLLAEVGMPNADYFCYYDDIEFTDRLTRSGASIYLCYHARITDIEISWHAATGRSHPAFSATTQDFRIYYDIRNALHFNRGRATNRFAYGLNGLLFWAGLVYLALFRSDGPAISWQRLKLAVRAARDSHDVCDSYPPLLP
jgi:GT2 family glycosyltransferase